MQEFENAVFIVMREAGEWDDYEKTPIKAFLTEEKAEVFHTLCLEEGNRIIAELEAWKKENEDLFNLDDYDEKNMTEEEIDDYYDSRSERDMEYAEKQVNIMKSHKYDEGIHQAKSLTYDILELELS